MCIYILFYRIATAVSVLLQARDDIMQYNFFSPG